MKRTVRTIGGIMLALLTLLPLSGCSMQDARAFFDNQANGTSFFHFDNPFNDLPEDPDLPTGADKKAGSHSTGVGSGSAKKSQRQKANEANNGF